jgi:hypothetical protein
MTLVLIDDKGDVWPGGLARLRQNFGSPYATNELSDYLVRNLGFVAINVYGKSCEIRTRPSIVSESTFDALVDWLAERHFERIVTSSFDQDWKIELHAASDIALQRLIQLVSLNQIARPGDFVSKAIDFVSLPQTSPLRSLLNYWPELARNVHRDGLRSILQQVVKGRFVLVNNNENRLVIEDMGDGFLSYDAAWMSRANGIPVEEQPDRPYGRWVASAYRQTLRQGIPSLSDVDAIITRPKEGRSRRRYKRLILPCTAGQGGSWLLAGSIIDDTIDLRVEALQKSV